VNETPEPNDALPRPPSASPGAAEAPGLFEHIYITYAGRLRKIAVRKFHIPPAEAETLVHDVFATYFMHAAAVKSVEPYLIGAICNASRYYLRRSEAAEALFCHENPCAATPAGAVVDEVERKMVLSRVLRGVGKRCRDLLHSYYVNGESGRSIAEVLHSTPATVHIFIHQCRQRALAVYRSMSERS